MNGSKPTVSKNPRFIFLQRQPRKFENVTLVARQRQLFWGFLVIFLLAQLPPKEVF